MSARDVMQVVFGFVLGASTFAGVAVAITPLHEILGVVADARQELRELSRVASRAQEPWVRQQVQRHADRLGRHLSTVERLAHQAPPSRPGPPVHRPPHHPPVHGPPVHHPVPAHPPEQVVQVVSDAEMSSLLAALRGEAFGDGRLALLGDVLRDRWFTTHQVVQVMETFSFGSEKVEAAARMYPQVVDPENWYTVYGALTFSSDKDALRQRVGR